MGAISLPHDAVNSSVQTSNIRAVSDDTLSVTVHVSHTPKHVCLGAIFTLFFYPLKEVRLYSDRLSKVAVIYVCLKVINWPHVSFPWWDWTLLHWSL